MLLPFIAFWVLMILALKDTEIYIEQAWPLMVVWLLAAVAFFLFPGWGLIGAAVVAIMDVVLLLMVLGGDAPAF